MQKKQLGIMCQYLQNKKLISYLGEHSHIWAFKKFAFMDCLYKFRLEEIRKEKAVERKARDFQVFVEVLSLFGCYFLVYC